MSAEEFQRFGELIKSPRLQDHIEAQMIRTGLDCDAALELLKNPHPPEFPDTELDI